MGMYSGGCVCGAIRYECRAEPRMMFKCHCRDCQHVTGGPYSPVLYFARKDFRLTKGRLTHYSTPSLAGGDHKRGFCGNCGSRISGGESDRGIGVVAGSLDDPAQFHPAMDMHVADAAPWDLLDPEMPKFDGYPPM